jgi:hypothetical protein
MARTRTRATSRSEASADKVLTEIEVLQDRERQVSVLLQQQRQGLLPAGYLKPEKATAEEIQAQEEKAAIVAGLEQQLAETRAEIKQKWDVVGGLSDPSGRLPGSDVEITQQINALETRLTQLRALDGRHRQTYHERLDFLLNQYGDRFEALVNGDGFGEFEAEEAAKLWPFLDPAFRARLHQGVDEHPAAMFAPGSRSSWEAERALVIKQISRRTAELALRASEKDAAEAEERKKQAEQVLAESSS